MFIPSYPEIYPHDDKLWIAHIFYAFLADNYYFSNVHKIFKNRFLIHNFDADHGRVPLAMVQTMKKLKSGYINGTRVMLGHLGDFLNTSAITDLSFLGSQEDGYPDREYFCHHSIV